jgi:integral membrane protein
MYTNKQIKQINLFRNISVAEGVSFLVLLLIAMPLKYAMGMPLAVKYIGWAHGVLFMAYVLQLFYLTTTLKWKFQRLFIYFIAALVPLAPFFIDRNLKRETLASSS